MNRHLLQIGRRLVTTLALAVCSATLDATAALAQDNSARASHDEIAKALAHLKSTLGSLNFPVDHVRYKGDLPGANSQDSWRIDFQSILPYTPNETTGLLVRPNIAILIDRPVPLLGGGDVLPTAGGVFAPLAGVFGNSGTRLGDIGFDISEGKTFSANTVVAAGVVGTLDTATDDAVGLGQYLPGPELAVAQVADWGVLGLLIIHQRDVAGMTT